MKKLFIVLVGIAVVPMALAAAELPCWQHPGVVEIDRYPMTATFETGGNKLSLNGVWDFKWYETLDDRDLGFYATDYDSSGWDTMPVPGLWELNGYGTSVIYTSGTTGKPKGAMLTHANFTEDASGALAAFGERIDESDSFFIVLPLFHAFSFLANFVLPLILGSTMCFMRSLRTISDDLKVVQPTVLMAVPLLVEKVFDRISEKVAASKAARFLNRIGLRAIVNSNIKKNLDPKLRFIVVGGAPCPVHVLEGFKKLGIRLLEGYGLTECSPVVSVAGPKVAKVGTIGHKLPNIEIRLADQNEAGVGELQVKGPIVMRGYYHNEQATKEAFDGEWFKTGDLASIDELGLITIRGRKKALIVNREGKNIYPEEVENVIAGDSLISDCVVIGYRVGTDPGEHVGVIVHPDEDALTARNGGTPMSWAEMEKVATFGIRTRCQRLADYKRPRKILVLHEPLERTSIQKVRRVAYKGMLDE